VRINVIGKGPQWQNAPERGEDGLCFGLNDHILKRDFDILFDMHQLGTRLEIPEPDPIPFKWRSKDKIKEALARAKELNCEVMSLEAWYGCSRYPIEDVVSKFNMNIFGSGFDFAFSYAMYLGATEIHVYGVWMSHKTEYVSQRHSAAVWVCLARGMGIDVTLNQNCEILKLRSRNIYGYDIKQSKFMTQYLTSSG